MTHEAKTSQTELSKYAWSLKRRGIAVKTNREILERATSYNVYHMNTRAAVGCTVLR